MKQFYYIFIFFFFTVLATAQDDTLVSKAELSARPISASTSTTGNSAEAGVTEGILNVSLTGNASYSIPILAPSGINSFEPQISVVYNSQSGLSGTAAIGWNISGISAITRIPSTKFHDGKIDAVDFNSFDRFALDGQRLIVKNGTSGSYGANGTTYETEYFSNIKVTSYGVHPNGSNFGPQYFIVEYPNGNKAYFGNSSDSRSVGQWSITYVENPQGIRINYGYSSSNNVLFISSVKYGSVGTEQPINEIQFVYDARETVEQGYIGGLYYKRDKNLKSIKVISSGIGFRNYDFGYHTQDRITSVTEKTGDNAKSYNPTNFEYSNSVTNPIEYIKADNSLDVGNITSQNASTVSGDFDGDGNMDFLLYPTMGASAKANYWLYTDANPSTPFSMSRQHNVGAFDDIFPVSYINSLGQLESNQGWTVVKGDTFTTFYLHPTWGILQNDQKTFDFPRFVLDYEYECITGNSQLNSAGEAFSPEKTTEINALPPEPGSKTEHYERDIPKRIISGDFNGDGITDAVAIEKSFTYPYRIGCGRYTQTYAGGRAFFINLDKRAAGVTEAGSMLSNDSSDIRIGDFNGDGKSDIFVFSAGSVKIYGLDDTLHFVLLCDKTDASIILDRPILMGDYNGDGKTEFMVPKAYGTSVWCKFTSTGISLLKEEVSTDIIFTANDPYNTHNYFSMDLNNDSKTDIIWSKSFRNSSNTLGAVTVYCYTNKNGAFSAYTIPWASTGDQAEINIYALPVYLPSSHHASKKGVYTASSTLQVAFLNFNKIHYFSYQSDYLSYNLLTNITLGNGAEQALSYVPLNSIYKNTYNSIYNPSLNIASYPNLDIKINPSLFVVSKIEEQSKSVYRKRHFGYYGAVTNLEGLGFIGFRSISQTNWHENDSQMITNILKFDLDQRGALTEEYSVQGMATPLYASINQVPRIITKGYNYTVADSDNLTATQRITLLPGTWIKPGSAFSAKINPEANKSSNTPTDFIAKSISTYESELLANKVFKLQNTEANEFNTLDGTNVQTINSFDQNNDIISSKILRKEGSTVVHTAVTDIAYESISSPYIVGRPISKNVSLSVSGHTMANKESYAYNSSQLLSNVVTSASGAASIAERIDYDAYGNVIKSTIIPPLPLQPRVASYEYDQSKRFVVKITDNDSKTAVFEYDANGLLKKEIDPYGLSRTYTYDSWFKNLTASDDQIGRVLNTAYAVNAEKTIVTSTVTSPGLDAILIEDTFDDLGRKIKSGAKDINGNMSYVSYLYDIYDRNNKTSEPYFGSSASKWNEVKYDVYGRNTDGILYNGRSFSMSYRPSSPVSTFKDGQKSKTTTQNAAGNTVSTSENIGGGIDFQYFANGNMRKASYNGLDITMEQNGWGSKTRLQDPSAGTYNYGYNDFQELISETKENSGIATTIVRDSKTGRPLTKTVTGSETNSVTNYTYDGSLPLTIDFTDSNEPAGSNRTLTTISYDSYKRVSTIIEEKFNVSKFTTAFTYDAHNRIATEIKTAEIGGASSSVYTRNVYKNGDLYQIIDANNNKVLWQTNELNEKGQIKEAVMGNGIKVSTVYNPDDGYLSKIKYDKISSGVNLLTLDTEFDKKTDNLKNRKNSAFGNYTETFDYDALDRLTNFTNRLGIQEIQNYDNSGKILSNDLGTFEYDPIKKYQNTAVNISTSASGYYSNREGFFNDSMEDGSGFGQVRNPGDVFYSYDETKAHSGKTSLKLANTTSSEKYVHGDKWINIDNPVDTQYTYSAWVYSDNPQAQMFLFMKSATETGYFSVVDDVVTDIKNQWVKIEKTFNVPAHIKKLNIRLDNNGSGNVWFDDIRIRKTDDPSSSERKLNITYNAFKSPIQIEETNVDKLSFSYNDDNQRSAMYYGGLQTVKFERPLRKYYSADGTMEVKQNMRTGAIEFLTYIGGDGYSAPVAAKYDGTAQNYLYLHRDYQGSILAVTNGNGELVEKRLFDAWGSIIKVQDGAGNALNGLTVLDRGYTGHEHLQSVALINMNARLYDPMLHRFLQTDNLIQDPTNTQNYNQYGYVLNNPLKYTDPSGNAAQGPGQDCVDCGLGAVIGNGIETIVQNWDNWKIKDWANKNINGDKLSRWAKDTFNLRNRFGGKKNEGPAPNLSRYANLATTGSGQFYGGDGSGSFMDYFSRFVYETDQFNPVALIWDGLKGNITGSDRYGNELTGFDSNMKIATALPITRPIGAISMSSKASISLVQANRTAGNLFRDELAAALQAEGRTVYKEVYKKTPFGGRYIDIEVWHNGTLLGGIETKVGNSRYHSLQRLKDAWLGAQKNPYPVQLVRKPSNW
jgi:RHS repeat-associated protein